MTGPAVRQWLKLHLQKLPLTTANFKKSDGGLFFCALFVIVGGAALLMFGR